MIANCQDDGPGDDLAWLGLQGDLGGQGLKGGAVSDSVHQEIEIRSLVGGFMHLSEGPQSAFRDCRPTALSGHREDLLLNPGIEPKESDDLGDAGAGDALPPGDLGPG